MASRTKRDPTAYSKERRYVLESAASVLESAFANGDEWLYTDGDPTEHAVRRREKALRSLIAGLRRKASMPHPK